MHFMQWMDNILCVPHMKQIFLNANNYQNLHCLAEKGSEIPRSSYSADFGGWYFPSISVLYAEQAQITSVFSLQCSFDSSFSVSILLQLQTRYKFPTGQIRYL